MFGKDKQEADKGKRPADAKAGEGAAQSAPQPEAKPGEGAAPSAPQPEAKSGEGAAPSAPQPEAKPAEPDWKDLYARLRADFDNYKKRAARDREDVYRYAEGDILKDILPTVDNLQTALGKAADKNDAFVKGVQLVCDNLLKALKEHGAEPFDSVGQVLDTEKMEAIANLPSPDVEEGKVSIESRKGWMLKGKVLRAAQVVVSSGKPEAK